MSNDQQVINIKEFDPSIYARRTYTSVILGCRRSGKTTLVDHDLLPSTGLDDRFHLRVNDSNELDRLVRVQQSRSRTIRNGNMKVDPRISFVLDDPLDIRMDADRNLRFLFMNGRCIDANLLIATNNYTQFPPAFRVNTDLVFLFWSPNHTLRRLYHDWADSIFSTFKEFQAAFTECTRNYGGCMVINNNYREEDRVFWYRVGKWPTPAVNRIARWWRGILARRRLARLRLGRELEHLPGVGIKYQQAMEQFNHHRELLGFS